MLRERFVRFFEQDNVRRLKYRERVEVGRALLLYGLGRRNSEQIRQLGLTYNVTDELYRLKSEFFDRTYYMVSLYWRACFEYFRQLPTPNQTGPTDIYLDVGTLKRAVAGIKTIDRTIRDECIRDVLLFEPFLSLDDQRQLYRLARATDYTTRTACDLLPIIKKLRRYCVSLVRRRMRFITKHDDGVTADDLENALFEAGLMTLHQYDGEPNALKLSNTAKRGARNYCIRLIEFHTARCRSRLIRHVAGKTVPYARRLCGTCAWFDVAGPDQQTCEAVGARPSQQPCRRKTIGNLYHVRVISEAHQCGNCLYYDRPGPAGRHFCVRQDVGPTARPCRDFELRVGVEQFMSTTASLDAPVGDETADRVSLIDFIPSADAQKPAENEWIERLLASLPEREARIVRITLGGRDEAFDRWLWSRTYQFSSEFTDSQLARYGCEFLGIDIDQVRGLLRQHLQVRRKHVEPNR